MPFEMQSHFPLGCGDDEKNLIAFIIGNDFMMEIRRFGEQTVDRSSIKRMTMHSRGAPLYSAPRQTVPPPSCRDARVVQMTGVSRRAQEETLLHRAMRQSFILVTLYEMIRKKTLAEFCNRQCYNARSPCQTIQYDLALEAPFMSPVSAVQTSAVWERSSK